MITKELLKKELDKVQSEYLDALYRVIKAFEPTVEAESFDQLISKETIKSDTQSSWHEFINATYGCLADDPIERGDQGKYEIREVIE